MPKYTRGSEVDLDEAYSDLLNRHAPARRNIRTKTTMHSAHHCSDPDCGGSALKMKCIMKLHFAFCLAPMVDEDPSSSAFGKVVIHGERFMVISPTGCAEHPYTTGYNLDLKDARNDRLNNKVLWKGIFAEFEAKHRAHKEHRAGKSKAAHMQNSIIEHQIRTMQTQQDNMEYQQTRHLTVETETGNTKKDEREDTDRCGRARRLRWAPTSQPSSTPDVAIPPMNTLTPNTEEPEPHIATFTPEDQRPVPMWL
jgi:hypothetical protein